MRKILGVAGVLARVAGLRQAALRRRETRGNRRAGGVADRG